VIFMLAMWSVAALLYIIAGGVVVVWSTRIAFPADPNAARHFSPFALVWPLLVVLALAAVVTGYGVRLGERLMPRGEAE
jgi:hypothetical protein